MVIKLSLDELKMAVGFDTNLKSDDLFEISTDTRTIKKGDIYLPLKGENFDGEKFCNNALEKGAYACFYTTQKPDGNSIKVDDTLKTYLKIANFARQKYNPIVIGVTGSSGKTTTKEMVYSVVSEKYKTQKTFSNHNNEIGFCQTVLSMDEDIQVLIVEMGMRGLGEIELITEYAQPDYAVITNAGTAHIGRLGSLDNIAKAKCEITKYLKKSLIANDNERIKKFANFSGEKIFYSINDVKILEKRIGYSKFEYKDKIYELNTDGDYNIENSLSAIEIGYKLNMSYDEIKSGLLKYKSIEKRWEVKNVAGYNIINDSYNANPDSMKAAVKTFLELYNNNSVVILGDMGELGKSEDELHKSVGKYIADNFSGCNVKFFTVGNLAKFIGAELEKSGFDVKYFDDNCATSRYILDNLDVGTTIFLKASRAMRFEEIIQNLIEREKTI